MTRESFWYLATPYSKYAKGLGAAFQEASRAAASLIKLNIRIYSPIAHTHPVAIYGGLDPLDDDLWRSSYGPIIDAAVGIIVVKMIGWEESEGVTEEIKIFREAEKPVLYMEWEDAIHKAT